MQLTQVASLPTPRRGGREEVRAILQHTSCSHKYKIVTIVVISRLVYRKGMDLLAGVIPIICHHHQDVDFLIGQFIHVHYCHDNCDHSGGDGNYRVLLEQIREENQLMERVILLGGLDHSDVRDVS